MLGGVGALAVLGACGGGGGLGGAPAAPSIASFTADRTDARVGETVRLSARFSGGSARIEPDIGPVGDGASVSTPALSTGRVFRLIVSAPGQPDAVRELRIDVTLRGRMQALTGLTTTLHAAAATTDGSVLVIGGSRGEGMLSSAIDRFDTDTGAFVRVGQLLTGRSGHSAVPLGDGRILVFGGSTSTNEAPFAEVIDERTGDSVRSGALRQPRNRHAAVRLADGRVLAIGGVARNSAEIWDPATGQWRLLDSRMAHPREYASATLLTNGRVLVFGGDAQTADYVSAEWFDPATERFSPVPDAPVQRRWLHNAHRLSDGRVLIGAGEGVVDGQVEMLASVWRVSPDGAGFTALPPLPSPRTLAATVLTPDDDWLLFGGQSPGESASAGALIVRGAQPREMTPLPGARSWHTATRLGDGRVLVVGGDDNAGAFVPGAAIYD